MQETETAEVEKSPVESNDESEGKEIAYLVKWKGQGYDAATWESLDDILALTVQLFD